MKGLLLIGVLAIASWTGYQWVSDVMVTERLSSAIEAAIDDPRTRPIDSIRRDIHQAFKAEGINLEPSAIGIVVSASNSQPPAGKMVSKAGLNTKTQRLTIHVTYKRRMWGTIRIREIERASVFVSAIVPPVSNTNRVLERARNLRDQFRNHP